MLGFETIGNATLTCFDGEPVLTTDPWITDSSYFGSWTLGTNIPKEQLDSILRCKYIWFSHGHPDHLNAESLPFFTGKQILLPDHVGGRIASSLKDMGFSVRVLPDRKMGGSIASNSRSLYFRLLPRRHTVSRNE